MGSFFFAVVGVVLLLFSGPTLSFNIFPVDDTFSPAGAEMVRKWMKSWLDHYKALAPSSDKVALSPPSAAFMDACKKKRITPQCVDELFDALERDASITHKCCIKVADPEHRPCFEWLVQDIVETLKLKPEPRNALVIKSEDKYGECEAQLPSDDEALSPSADDDY